MIDVFFFGRSNDQDCGMKGEQPTFFYWGRKQNPFSDTNDQSLQRGASSELGKQKSPGDLREN